MDDALDIAKTYEKRIAALPKRRRNLVLAMFAAIAMREYIYFAALNERNIDDEMISYFSEFDTVLIENKEINQHMDNIVDSKICIDIDSEEYDNTFFTISSHQAIMILNIFFRYIEMERDDILIEYPYLFIQIQLKKFELNEAIEIRTIFDSNRIVTSLEFAPYLAEMDTMIALSADEAKATEFIRAKVREPSPFCPTH